MPLSPDFNVFRASHPLCELKDLRRAFFPAVIYGAHGVSRIRGAPFVLAVQHLAENRNEIEAILEFDQAAMMRKPYDYLLKHAGAPRNHRFSVGEPLQQGKSEPLIERGKHHALGAPEQFFDHCALQSTAIECFDVQTAQLSVAYDFDFFVRERR